MKPDKHDIEKLQEIVLIGIGRNVLNLQKMEGMLKSLVYMVNLNIPADNAKTAARMRHKVVSKMPLGRLVDDFVRSVHPNSRDNATRTVDSTMGSFGLSFTFDDAEFVQELKASMRRVVKERNQLIHKKLAGFDPKSPESCRDLAKDLEKQRQRIKPQFEALVAILSAARKGFNELADNIDSDKFESEARIAADRAQETNQ